MSRSAKWKLTLQSILCSGDIVRSGAAGLPGRSSRERVGGHSRHPRVGSGASAIEALVVTAQCVVPALVVYAIRVASGVNHRWTLISAMFILTASVASRWLVT
jgi:hypothetical protein